MGYQFPYSAQDNITLHNPSIHRYHIRNNNPVDNAKASDIIVFTPAISSNLFSRKKTGMQIGIVGLGDMGQLYVQQLCKSDLVSLIHVCDLPAMYEHFDAMYHSQPRVKVWKSGHEVVRRCDFIIYSVETENISSVVSAYSKSTRVGAIVGGQTSVKKPEIEAFEKYLPEDVDIVTLHSLHGPSVDPAGQPLILMRHRCNDDAKYFKIRDIIQCFQSEIVELSYKQHDLITADTQAVTHLAFLSMGSAWKSTGVFPWLNNTYTGGIENAKIMMTLRIYASKWHVYAGLAIMNPDARPQVAQYAKSASELFKMMIQEKSEEFSARIKIAAKYVFDSSKDPLLLSDSSLDEYSLSSVPLSERKPNSHLSLLAIVDSWYHLKINPYHHMICQTPPFRLWLGITEYLFKTPELLESSINAALYDKTIRADDLEFVNATQAWSQTILLGSMEGYKQKFEETSSFFVDRLEEGKRISTLMLRRVTKKNPSIN